MHEPREVHAHERQRERDAHCCFLTASEVAQKSVLDSSFLFLSERALYRKERTSDRIENIESFVRPHLMEGPYGVRSRNEKNKGRKLKFEDKLKENFSRSVEQFGFPLPTIAVIN